MEFERVDVVKDHPLEEVFGIIPGTTVTSEIVTVHEEMIEDPTYDDKDLEIERQFDEIYQIALDGVASISSEINVVEGKYKARVGEVLATNLSVALQAAKEKAHLKAHKDKLVASSKKSIGPDGEGNVTNNNLLVTDHASVIRLLQQAQGQ